MGVVEALENWNRKAKQQRSVFKTDVKNKFRAVFFHFSLLQEDEFYVGEKEEKSFESFQILTEI